MIAKRFWAGLATVLAAVLAVILMGSIGSVSARADAAVVNGDATKLQGLQAEYTAGDPIYVTPYSSGQYDWIALHKPFDSASSYWKYITEGTGSASNQTIGLGSGVTFDLLTQSRKVDASRTKLWPGKYIIRVLPTNAAGTSSEENLDKAVAWAEITILPDSTQNYDPDSIVQGDYYESMVLEKDTFEQGEPIYVTATTDEDLAVSLYYYRGGMIDSYNVSSVGSGVRKDVSNGRTLAAGQYVVRLRPSNNSGAHALAKAWAVINVVPPVQDRPAAPSNVVYALSNETDGFAAGILTITLSDYDPNVARDIVMYWADDNGPLAGYSSLQMLEVTGPTVMAAIQPGQLIPYGATRLYVYQKNTASGEISLNPFIVDLPAGAAKDPGTPIFEFQVVSDTHVGRTIDHPASFYEAHFTQMLNDIAMNMNNSAGIFIVGDMADHGYDSEYQRIQELHDAVAALPRMYYTLGNHDVRNAGESGKDIDAATERFCRYAFLPDGTHPTDTSYDFWLNGYHFIFLGTDVWHDPRCILNDDTIDWFKEKLDEGRESLDPGQPTFVFTHQSILNTVAGCLDYQWPAGAIIDPTASRLIEVYKDHPEVVLFNGHSHFELISDYEMYVPTSQLPIHIFNTASVGYTTCEYRGNGEYYHTDGSQGLYVRMYADKLIVTGRNFDTGEWMPSAHMEVIFGDDTRDAWTSLPKGDGHTHCICGADHEPIGIMHAYEVYETFQPASALPAPEANLESVIYLTSDVTLTETYILKEGQKLKICLNGHTISGDGSFRLFYLPEKSGNAGAELIITDCSAGQTGTLDAGNSESTPIAAQNEYVAGDGSTVTATAGGQIIKAMSSGSGTGKLRLYNITLKNGWTSDRGGAIDTGVQDTLLYNVTFKDCGTAGNGGALSCYGGRTHNLYSCTIENCKAKNGGAIVAQNATTEVVVHDTTITSCTGTAAGGALYSGLGTIVLYGDTVITKCTAPKGGAGYFATGKQSGETYAATLKMYGGLVGGSAENKNWASNGQGGAFLFDGANFYMAGGEISYSTAGHGGNVVVQSGGTGEMRGGRILYGSTSNSSANLGGGNLGLYSDGTVFTMKGGEIAYGNAKSNGGNIVVRDANTNFIMTGGLVREGYAQGGYGGNIFVTRNNSTTTFGEVTITGTAVVAGGSVATGSGYGGNIGLGYRRPVTISGNAKILNGTAMRGGNIGGNNIGQLTIADNAVIANGNTTQVGGNIYLGGHADNWIHMTGGTVQDGHSNQWGGNIVIFKAKEFIMTGGAILDGSATGGCNLAISPNGAVGEIDIQIKGSAVIAGGVQAASGDGGNIRVLSNTAYVNMVIGGDAVVTGGEVTGWGGNAFIGSCTSSGYKNLLTITDNAKIGTDITIDKTTYTYNNETGAVTEATASKTYSGGKAGYGGNIGLYGTAVDAVIESGTIVNGTAATDGNSVFKNNTGTLTVNGGTIDEIKTTGGTATVNGGYINTCVTSGGVMTVNGGYYVVEPDEAIIASGLKALRGVFANPDTSDPTQYLFCVKEASKGVFIDAEVEVTGAAGFTATVTGIGDYYAGAEFTLTANAVEGLRFLGWYLDGAKVGENTVYQGEALTDQTFIAKFDVDPAFVILYIKAPSFNYQIGDADPAAATTGVTCLVRKGTEVTTQYTYDEDALFAWVNESDKLLSNEDPYTFTVNTSMMVKAAPLSMSADAVVVFMTEYDQVYATRNVTGGVLTEEMPNTPYRLGSTTNWDKTEAEILEEASMQSPVIVTLQSVPNADVYTVVVNADDAPVFEREVTLGQSVTVSLPAENFLYVKLGGKIISYEPEFRFRADSATTMTAFYGTDAVEKESLVTMTIVSGVQNAISFAATRVVIEDDAEVAEQGILYAVTELSEDAFVKGAAGVGAAVSNQMTKKDVTVININTKTPKTVYARAYVVLMDGTVLYSDIVSATSL